VRYVHWVGSVNIIVSFDSSGVLSGGGVMAEGVIVELVGSM
jgi:hypothetical protein